MAWAAPAQAAQPPGQTAAQWLSLAAQVQACVTLWALCCCWALSGARRLRGARAVLRTVGEGHRARRARAVGGSWPPVSVVLPTRGGAGTPEALAAALALAYDGAVEVLVGAERGVGVDDAAAALAAAQQALAGSGGRAAIRPAKVVAAGPAVRCSQKIAQQLACVEVASAAAEYVLFLDDDVLVPPHVLETMVSSLEDTPEALMATGFPFDLPARAERSEEGASLLARLMQHALMQHHLPLLVPFSTAARGHFVWGGCMLFRASELRADAHGLVTRWRDGGYSDDLIAAAASVHAARPVLSPAAAFFPQRVGAAGATARAYWGYLRRQLFVLTMWAYDGGGGGGDRCKNPAMATAHACLSAAMVLGVGCALRVLLRAACGGGGGRGAEARLGGEEVALAAVTVWLFACAVAAATAITRSLAALSELLYLAGAMDGDDAGSGDTPMAEAMVAACDDSAISPLLLGAAMLLHHALVPVALTYTAASSTVVWAGRRYHRRRGKVHRVEVLAES